jgi:hypothetical protein
LANPVSLTREEGFMESHMSVKSVKVYYGCGFLLGLTTVLTQLPVSVSPGWRS